MNLIVKTAIVTGCAAGAIGGGSAMSFASEDCYTVKMEATSTVHFIVEGDRIITLTEEDLDDIRAIEEARRSGPSTSFDEFDKELGL